MFDPENVSNLFDQINWTTIFRLEQTLFCCSALLLQPSWHSNVVADVVTTLWHGRK